MFLLHLIRRGSDTVLGETSDPREIFVVNTCEDISFGVISKVATVQFRPIPANWAKLGGDPFLVEDFPDDGKSFFYQKCYDSLRGRFEDVPSDISCPESGELATFCECCEKQRLMDSKNLPFVAEPLDEEKSAKDEVNSLACFFSVLNLFS